MGILWPKLKRLSPRERLVCFCREPILKWPQVRIFCSIPLPTTSLRVRILVSVMLRIFALVGYLLFIICLLIAAPSSEFNSWLLGFYCFVWWGNKISLTCSDLSIAREDIFYTRSNCFVMKESFKEYGPAYCCNRSISFILQFTSNLTFFLYPSSLPKLTVTPLLTNLWIHFCLPFTQPLSSIDTADHSLIISFRFSWAQLWMLEQTEQTKILKIRNRQ